MKNKIEVFKISGYDEFKCVANKCKFTCCEGMDVSVDNKTFNKWNNEKDKFKNVLSNVRVNKVEGAEKYIIDKRTEDRCPMMDKNGLCEIVKNHGDEYISLTCQSFPRIKNDFKNKTELSLSCSCPEVVEFISNIKGYINMDSFDDFRFEKTLEFELRETLINIMKRKDIELDYKLIISFQMLLITLENRNISEEKLIEEIKVYESEEYINELLKMYKSIELNRGESIEELSNLFSDIVENYRNVSGLSSVLEEIFNFSEEIEIEYLSDKWDSYKVEFKKYSKIVENCIISKILSNCINKDIEDVTISFQLIILEILLTRFALLLKYCIDGELNIEEVKDYIVVFSRIIENNNDAVIEFLSEGFGSEILEEGYICFISIF